MQERGSDVVPDCDIAIRRPAVSNALQVSLAKNVKVREKLNCDVRFDIQNPFKRPNFVNPVAVTNLTNPGTFGKPTATVGSWSGLGGSFLATLGVKLWF